MLKQLCIPSFFGLIVAIMYCTTVQALALALITFSVFRLSEVI